MKKSLIIFILFFTAIPVLRAQSNLKDRNSNLPYFEKQKFHFGFTLGANVSNFKLDYDLTTIDSLISLQVGPQSGFNIGFLGSMRLNHHFTVRFLPALAFAQRNVNYVFDAEPKNVSVTKMIESTYVMFPIHMKYRSARYNNFATYVIGGANFALDLASQFDLNNNLVISEQVLKVKRENMYAEIGAGADFFLEYFKFSVEFKYSLGINNVLIKDQSFWAIPINEIKARMFTISLHFEG